MALSPMDCACSTDVTIVHAAILNIFEGDGDEYVTVRRSLVADAEDIAVTLAYVSNRRFDSPELAVARELRAALDRPPADDAKESGK